MKDKIIEQSIIGLQNDGLRFSVDLVAQQLKISKKTVYKYFATKEELARAVYKRFYDDIFANAVQTEKLCREEKIKNLLQTYGNSAWLNSDAIFNKYALNAPLRAFAEAQHAAIWALIENCLQKDQQFRQSAKLIVDAVCEKSHGNVAEKVLEMLTEMLL